MLARKRETETIADRS